MEQKKLECVVSKESLTSTILTLKKELESLRSSIDYDTYKVAELGADLNESLKEKKQIIRAIDQFENQLAKFKDED